MHEIFVYGTLKKGFANHDGYLASSIFVGNAITMKKYPMILQSPAYPHLVNIKGEGYHIKGEVYSVDDVVLSSLDELEGYPEHYYRECIDVRLTDGVVKKTMVYFCSDCKDYKRYEMISEFKNWLDED